MPYSTRPTTRLQQALAGALIAASCLIGAPAQASLVGSAVNVNLLSPIDLVDANTLVNVNAVGTSISSQDSPANTDPTMVQSYMQTGSPNTLFESITFNASSITLRLLSAGYNANGDPTTGWSAGAEYRFTGLDLAGSTITGFTDSGSGITNLASLDGSGWITLASPHEIDLQLADIVFAPGSGGTSAYGDVTINLIGQPTTPPTLPEPGSLALCGLALAALGAARRRPSRR